MHFRKVQPLTPHPSIEMGGPKASPPVKQWLAFDASQWSTNATIETARLDDEYAAPSIFGTGPPMRQLSEHVLVAVGDAPRFRVLVVEESLVHVALQTG